MPTTLQDHDFLIVREDGRFHIWQIQNGRRAYLEGPHERVWAVSRAADLAASEGSDAWIEEAPGVFHLL